MAERRREERATGRETEEERPDWREEERPDWREEERPELREEERADRREEEGADLREERREEREAGVAERERRLEERGRKAPLAARGMAAARLAAALRRAGVHPEVDLFLAIFAPSSVCFASSSGFCSLMLALRFCCATDGAII